MKFQIFVARTMQKKENVVGMYRTGCIFNEQRPKFMYKKNETKKLTTNYRIKLESKINAKITSNTTQSNVYATKKNNKLYSNLNCGITRNK